MGWTWAGFQLSIGWLLAGYRLSIGFLLAGYTLAAAWLTVIYPEGDVVFLQPVEEVLSHLHQIPGSGASLLVDVCQAVILSNTAITIDPSRSCTKH